MSMHDTVSTLTPEHEDRLNWMEFRQDYEGGLHVLKRGLDASPVVVRKHRLAPDQVIAFSDHRGRRKAISVFHFHPAFPAENRDAYMRGHDDGRQLIGEYLDHRAETGRRRMARWRGRAEAAARAAGVAVHAVGMFVAAHLATPR